MKKLYVKLDNTVIDNPRDFLLYYLKRHNPTTYYDEEFKNPQCFQGRGRSFNEMFKLTKTYFPNLKLDEFAYYVISLRKQYSYLKRNQNGGFFVNLIGCPDINKVVFFKTGIVLGSIYTISLTRRGLSEYPYEMGGKLNFDGIKKLAKRYEKTLL